MAVPLGLGQPFGCRFQLSGMRNLLASREGEEMAKAGINPGSAHVSESEIQARTWKAESLT